MCSECRQTPCDPRCPNAPEPPTIYTCKYCGEPIVAGDEFMEFDGEYYHREDCGNDVALKLFYEDCGASFGTAEEEEDDRYDEFY